MGDVLDSDAPACAQLLRLHRAKAVQPVRSHHARETAGSPVLVNPAALTRRIHFAIANAAGLQKRVQHLHRYLHHGLWIPGVPQRVTELDPKRLLLLLGRQLFLRLH